MDCLGYVWGYIGCGWMFKSKCRDCARIVFCCLWNLGCWNGVVLGKKDVGIKVCVYV